MSEQGPRQPLEERDAEIERLTQQIRAKDEALQVAREWLGLLMQNYHETGGERDLDEILLKALRA